jgi:hypothetical protein
MEEVIGDWRKLHNEELHDLYLSLNVIRVINSRSLRLVVLVACMGEKKILRVLGRQGTDSRMILKWILNRMGGHQCSHPDEDRDRWWTVVDMVISFGLYILNAGNFLIADELLTFQEGPCSMEQTFITLFTKACHSILTQSS